MQRAIATKFLHIGKQLFVDSCLACVIFSAFAVLICSSESFAQDPDEAQTTNAEKPQEGSKASEDDPSNLIAEESKAQPQFQNPPRELITQEESDEYRKRRERFFKSAMRNGKRTATSNKYIEEGIRVWVYRMSLKENQRRVQTRMGDLLRQVRSAGRGEKRVQPKKVFRTFLCKEILARAKDLLDNNNEVRLNATILISELNVTEPGSRNKPPAVAYGPATVVLLEILQDENQPVPVKIQAARGITRNALLGEPVLLVKHKNDLVQTIVKELEKAKKLSRDQAGPWYQARLLETLAAVNLPLTVQGDPLIFLTLESFLDDSKLELSVRCMAARSLGRARLPTHPQIDSQRLSLKLAKLGLDLTNGYNKNMLNFPRWQKYFWDLYVAFQPETDYDKTLYSNRKLGLLAKYPNRKEIRDAYEKILPLAAHVLKQPVLKNGKRFIIRLPENQIQALSNWIKNHPQAANLPGVPSTTNVSTDSSR